MLQHMDLFSGIGGFADALEATGGFETVALCEIEEYCQGILRKHRPGVPLFDDVRSLNYDGSVDIITGGFPCQPFSLAGKRQGTKDDRHLWPVMFGLIEKHRPRWVIGENVDGFTSMVQFDSDLEMDSKEYSCAEKASGSIAVGEVRERIGRGILDEALGDLGSIGYSVQTFSIPACAVDAQHRRQRVWIVAHTDTGRQSNVTVNERQGRGELGENVSNTNKLNDDRAGHGTSTICGERSSAPEIFGSENVANSGRGRCGEPGEGKNKQSRRTEAFSASEDVANTKGQSIRPGLCKGEQGEQWRRRFGDSGGKENASDSNGARSKARLSESEQREKRNAGEFDYCSGKRNGWQEQGFWLPEPGICRVVDGLPDRVHRIKALGNAIVPQVAHRIALAILAVEAQYD